ncbi:hypothetical protein, partial [Bacillus pseudomycoides]|uniref:hypothetical protein n=1 Tax=Bacillus pseudomycoides TaxID=64104 RepID=UPI001955107F
WERDRIAVIDRKVETQRFGIPVFLEVSFDYSIKRTLGYTGYLYNFLWIFLETVLSLNERMLQPSP